MTRKPVSDVRWVVFQPRMLVMFIIDIQEPSYSSNDVFAITREPALAKLMVGLLVVGMTPSTVGDGVAVFVRVGVAVGSTLLMT